MPVTIAHPAAILPLRGLGLPTAALVAGSVTPDLPLLLGQGQHYSFTHGWIGLVSFDLVAAVVLVALWDHGVRDALVDLSPEPVRRRVAARRRLTRLQWVAVPVAAVVGSLTHVLWDAFTHVDRWGLRWLPWLYDDLGPLPTYKWAQYLSGILGTLVVVGAVVRAVRRSQSPPETRARVLPVLTLPAALVGAGAVGAVAGLARLPDGLRAVAFAGVVVTIVAVSLAVLGVTGAWLVAARARSRRTG